MTTYESARGHGSTPPVTQQHNLGHRIGLDVVLDLTLEVIDTDAPGKDVVVLSTGPQRVWPGSSNMADFWMRWAM